VTVYLSAADITQIITSTLGEPEEVVADAGLLLAAVERPGASLRNAEVYPTFAEKAAVLVESIARHAPLIDGNKRVAWLCLNVFAELNGHSLGFSDNEAYNLLIEVAKGRLATRELAQQVAHHLHPLEAI
jgi:death-on-curing protein